MLQFYDNYVQKMGTDQMIENPQQKDKKSKLNYFLGIFLPFVLANNYLLNSYNSMTLLATDRL